MANKLRFNKIEKLQDALDKDLAWRKKEMLSLRLLVESDSVNESILLRAGIALLCAHFEGFIKYSSNCYVAYVSGQKVASNTLKNGFIAIKMEKEFKACSDSAKHSVHARLIDKYNSIVNDKYFRLDVNDEELFIKTNSNPNCDVIKDILLTLGIETDLFETKKNYIDSSLLEKRHKVVHGERSELDKKDFLTTFEIIMDLLDEFHKLICTSAENRIYLKIGDKNGEQLSNTDTN